MGRDKALLQFCGEPLIGRVLRRLLNGGLDERVEKIIVTTNNPGLYQFLEKQYHPRLELAGDIVNEVGALGGLYTALMTSQAEIIAVVACDLPFADAEIIKTGYDQLIEHGYDGFVPCTRAGLEPLHALYRTESCLPLVEKAVSSGQRKVTAWFPQANIFEYHVEEREPSPFFNVNTPEEFEKALVWAKHHTTC